MYLSLSAYTIYTLSKIIYTLIHDINNKTTLIIASQKGHHHVVKFFITFPAIDVNATDL